VNQYKDAISTLASVYESELNTVMRSLPDFEQPFVEGSLSVEELTEAYKTFSDIASTVQERMEELQSLGVPAEELAIFSSIMEVAGSKADQLAEILNALGISIQNLQTPIAQTADSLNTFIDGFIDSFSMGIDLDDFIDFESLQGGFLSDSKDVWNSFVGMGKAAASEIGNIMGSALGEAMNQIGENLAMGENAMDGFGRSMAAMLVDILKLVSSLAIAAGLRIIAETGAAGLPVGLTLIGLGIAGSIGAGFLSTKLENASGDDSSGSSTQIAPMAKGGVLNSPTLLSASGDMYLAGEAGQEAIMPLTRTPSGDLGVQAIGGGSETPVNVTINNYAGAEVEQKDDGQGNIEITLRRYVGNMIASGDLDRSFRSRYGMRASG
jgi:hypothetical protein